MFAARRLRTAEQDARPPKTDAQSNLIGRSRHSLLFNENCRDHYAIVAAGFGLKLNAKKLDAAFYSAWKHMPPREAIDGPRR